MRKALNRFGRYYLPVLVYLVLVFFLFLYAGQAAAQNTQLSLRYTDYPLTGAQVAYAKGYAQDPDNESPYTLSFWYQLQDTTVANDFGASQTAAVYVDGEMRGVYPVEFLAGGYPTSIDKNGIAVSEMLGWRLFGGGEVVGSVLEWNGQEYIVRGVFEGLDPMVLVQVDAAEMPEQAFTGVELNGAPQFGDPRAVALEFVGKAGLGAPTAVVDGGAMSTLMMLMAVLPLVVLIIWFLVQLLKEIHRAGFWVKNLVWFAVLLGLAFAIPWGLNQLPGWMIPNKWSDLDSWSDFFTTMRAYVNEWLSLYPSMRDVQMKLELLRQALLMVPALFAVTVTIRVWNRRLRAILPAAQAPAEVAEFQVLPPEEGGVLEAALEDGADNGPPPLLLQSGGEPLHVEDLADDEDDLLFDIPNAGHDGEDPRFR